MTVQFEAICPSSYTAKVRGVDFPVNDIHSLPEISLKKIMEYGLQRIFNDSAASAKTDEEAVALATKRLDNLRNGIMRASTTRVGDPVKRRALEIIMPKITSSAKFIAWAQENGLKVTDKKALAEARIQADKHLAVEGNAFMAQAAIDVAAAKGLDIEIEF